MFSEFDKIFIKPRLDCFIQRNIFVAEIIENNSGKESSLDEPIEVDSDSHMNNTYKILENHGLTTVPSEHPSLTLANGSQLILSGKKIIPISRCKINFTLFV